MGLVVFIGLSIKLYSFSIPMISSSNWLIRKLFLSSATWMRDFLLFKFQIRSIEGIFRILKINFKVDVIVCIAITYRHLWKMPFQIPMSLR